MSSEESGAIKRKMVKKEPGASIKQSIGEEKSFKATEEWIQGVERGE
jgi:hypothetical protein